MDFRRAALGASLPIPESSPEATFWRWENLGKRRWVCVWIDVEEKRCHGWYHCEIYSMPMCLNAEWWPMPEASHVYREMYIPVTTSERSNVNGYLCETAWKTFDSAGVVFYDFGFLQTFDFSGVIQIYGLLIFPFDITPNNGLLISHKKNSRHFCNGSFRKMKLFIS